MALKRPKAIKVFFPYSHEDEQLRDKLGKHLTILSRQGVISSWHDRKIGAGRNFQGEIDTHLNTADLILLLISSDFLGSDYCYDVEMKRAMQRHKAGEARVIPIILRACNWKVSPFGKLEVLPEDAKPVTSWANRDEAFYNVARGIREAVEERIASPPEPILQPASQASKSELYTLRRLPDSSFTLEEREILVKDSESRARKLVPGPGLRRKICRAAKILLKRKEGKSLRKKELERLDARFLARGSRRPDAELIQTY